MLDFPRTETSHAVHFSDNNDNNNNNNNNNYNAIPLQAWIVRVGSRSLRLPDFKTFGT